MLCFCYFCFRITVQDSEGLVIVKIFVVPLLFDVGVEGVDAELPYPSH